MSLPPFTPRGRYNVWTPEQVREYGRQCWNAAIDFALQAIVEEGHPVGQLERAKIPASTVSQEP
jgi:hypothetical protein